MLKPVGGASSKHTGEPFGCLTLRFLHHPPWKRNVAHASSLPPRGGGGGGTKCGGSQLSGLLPACAAPRGRRDTVMDVCIDTAVVPGSRKSRRLLNLSATRGNFPGFIGFPEMLSFPSGLCVNHLCTLLISFSPSLFLCHYFQTYTGVAKIVQIIIFSEPLESNLPK